MVTVLAAGAWIANLSRTHALYVEGDGYQVRLPRMEDDGEPANGWFVHTGTAMVGSRAMLDEGQSLVVTVTGQYEEAAAAREARQADGAGLAGAGWPTDGGLDRAGGGWGRNGRAAAGAGMAGRLTGPMRLMPPAWLVRPRWRTRGWPTGRERCCRSTWTR